MYFQYRLVNTIELLGENNNHITIIGNCTQPSYQKIHTGTQQHKPQYSRLTNSLQQKRNLFLLHSQQVITKKLIYFY